MALKHVAKQHLFVNKKGVVTQHILIEVLVYHAEIREATPRDASQSAYHLPAKITSFLSRESKR